jgi:hypothetical protein
MLFPKPIYLIYCKKRQPTKVQVNEKSSGIDEKLKENLQKPLLPNQMNMNEGASNEDAVIT